VREGAPEVPIGTIIDADDSQDILELSGATHVLPIKRWLGEQLARRVNAQHAELSPIGQYRDLRLAELLVHNTPQNFEKSRIRKMLKPRRNSPSKTFPLRSPPPRY